jgi:hypothetical protein
VKTIKNGRQRRARDLGLPFTALLVYALSGPAVRFLHRPVQNERLARLEERLFGRVPTVALQRHLDRPEGLSAWTGPLAVVYLSHFVVPSLSWVWLWSRDRERWTRWNREFLVLAAASLLTYVVVPAAPPWMASRDGYIGPVRRLSSPGLAKLGWTSGARRGRGVPRARGVRHCLGGSQREPVRSVVTGGPPPWWKFRARRCRMTLALRRPPGQRPGMVVG